MSKTDEKHKKLRALVVKMPDAVTIGEGPQAEWPPELLDAMRREGVTPLVLSEPKTVPVDQPKKRALADAIIAKPRASLEEKVKIARDTDPEILEGAAWRTVFRQGQTESGEASGTPWEKNAERNADLVKWGKEALTKMPDHSWKSRARWARAMARLSEEDISTKQIIRIWEGSGVKPKP